VGGLHQESELLATTVFGAHGLSGAPPTTTTHHTSFADRLYSAAYPAATAVGVMATAPPSGGAGQAAVPLWRRRSRPQHHAPGDGEVPCSRDCHRRTAADAPVRTSEWYWNAAKSNIQRARQGADHAMKEHKRVRAEGEN